MKITMRKWSTHILSKQKYVECGTSSSSTSATSDTLPSNAHGGSTGQQRAMGMPIALRPVQIL